VDPVTLGLVFAGLSAAAAVGAWLWPRGQKPNDPHKTDPPPTVIKGQRLEVLLRPSTANGVPEVVVEVFNRGDQLHELSAITLRRYLQSTYVAWPTLTGVPPSGHLPVILKPDQSYACSAVTEDIVAALKAAGVHSWETLVGVARDDKGVEFVSKGMIVNFS
jgi:hypothetical protein